VQPKESMKRRARLYLRYSEWPSDDKTLWKQAFEPKVDPFDDGGPGAHLSKRTVQQLQYAYGKFLYFNITGTRWPAQANSRSPAESKDH
jgi:hypothetical protein